MYFCGVCWNVTRKENSENEAEEKKGYTENVTDRHLHFFDG